MNSSLQAPISMKEVMMAAFDVGALKAPGPYGFSGTFYQHHWETVQEVKLVMSCVTSVNYSIILNGKPGPWFTPCGLRQGDPLSPFLFLFVNDVLSKMLLKTTTSNLIRPVRLGPQQIQVFIGKLRTVRVYQKLKVALASEIFKSSMTHCLQNKYGDSISSQTLFQHRDLIKSSSCWDIGNGDSVNLWFDSWIPGPSPSPLNVGNGPLQTREFIQSQPINTKLHQPPSRLHVTSWIPPPPNSIKINSDAAWKADSNLGGIAVIVRDSTGPIISGHTGKTYACSALAAELIAICDGLILLSSLPSTPVMFASDSKIIIDAFKSNTPPKDWKIANLFSQARYLSSTRQISWLWTSRKANRAADHLAALALCDSCPANWIVNPPVSLMNVLVADGFPGPPKLLWFFQLSFLLLLGQFGRKFYATSSRPSKLLLVLQLRGTCNCIN
ncbi:hypothetical protein ACLB2K_040401 [Fragaria x ananassa]